MPLAQVWTHWGFNWIFLPSPIFAICLNFQQQNSLKNQYLSHLSSENCQINSIKSDSLRAFRQHQEWPQIPLQFSVSALFSFYWESGSIINSFHTIAPNSLKPSWGTPTHWKLFEDTKSTTWRTVAWKISAWQTKENKTEQNKPKQLPCFIDRFLSSFVLLALSFLRLGFLFLLFPHMPVDLSTL